MQVKGGAEIRPQICKDRGNRSRYGNSQLYLSMAAAVNRVEFASSFRVDLTYMTFAILNRHVPHLSLNILALPQSFQSQIGSLMTIFQQKRLYSS